MLQDAETRFEDQISKLVLEKQELEWEKVLLGLAGFTSTSLISIFWIGGHSQKITATCILI